MFDPLQTFQFISDFFSPLMPAHRCQLSFNVKNFIIEDDNDDDGTLDKNGAGTRDLLPRRLYGD